MLKKKRLEIVAAIDTSPFSIAVLDEAAVYAKYLDADLKVVLVEDENMVKAAKSPLVRSVNLFSFSSGSICMNEVKDIYSLQRKTAMKTVKYAEEKYGINIKLEILQGKVYNEIMKSAEGAAALIIGMAGWKFAKYYYSTHMIEKQSRFKFPDETNIKVGHTAKQLLKNYKGTIFALRSSVFKKSKIMFYYDGTKEAKIALANAVEYLGKLKPNTNPSMSILLDDKNLRNEAFVISTNRDKSIVPAFHVLKEGSSLENLKYVEKLIDNTKSTMLLLPGSCRFVQETEFYDELSTIHSSIVIMR